MRFLLDVVFAAIASSAFSQTCMSNLGEIAVIKDRAAALKWLLNVDDDTERKTRYKSFEEEYGKGSARAILSRTYGEFLKSVGCPNQLTATVRLGDKPISIDRLITLCAVRMPRPMTIDKGEVYVPFQDGILVYNGDGECTLKEFM